MNKLIIILLMTTGCAHLTTPPPSPRVQMECNQVDLGNPELTGLVCRTTSVNAFIDYFTKTQDWADAAWAKCGHKQKVVNK